MKHQEKNGAKRYYKFHVNVLPISLQIFYMFLRYTIKIQIRFRLLKVWGLKNVKGCEIYF